MHVNFSFIILALSILGSFGLEPSPALGAEVSLDSYQLRTTTAEPTQDFETKVEAEFKRTSSSCIFAPQSGATEELNVAIQAACEQNLREQIRTNFSKEEIAKLKQTICDPGCETSERERLKTLAQGLCRASCQARLPKILHSHIKSCDEETSCAQSGKSALATGASSASIAAAKKQEARLQAALQCADAVMKGSSQQLKAFLDNAVKMPAQVSAAPPKLLESIGRAMFAIAKDGAHDFLMKSHGSVMYSAEDLAGQAKGAVQGLLASAGPAIECLPPEKALELSCYLGGVGTAALAEGVLISKGAGLILSLEQTQLLLQNVAALLDRRPTIETMREHAALLAKSGERRHLRALLASDGKKNPQLKVWHLRENGREAEAAALEAALKKEMSEGDIKDLGRVGKGGSGAEFVRFPSGAEGVWKPYSHSSGIADGNAEIAAYSLDRHLGLNQVPLTVERMHNGQRGTVQLRVKEIDRWKELKDAPGEFQLLDRLIANWDRRSDNYVQTRSGRRAAIDNGVAFVHASGKSLHFDKTMRDHMDPVDYHRGRLKMFKIQDAEGSTAHSREQIARSQKWLDENESGSLQQVRQVVGEKAVYERLKATTREDWDRILSPHLTSQQIRDVSERQVIILKEIEKARRVFGERVFSDSK